MKYYDFFEVFQTVPAFSTLDMEKHFPGFEKENLINWQKKGYLIKIRNNWYCRRGAIRDLSDLFFIANKIYTPSYISLESAFSYYGWIPEGVFAITSVTTLKTSTFNTPIGYFRYSTLKPELFFGYEQQKVGHHPFKIADPEKAILDFLYLHPEMKEEESLLSMRLLFTKINNDIDMVKLANYLALFDSRALETRFSIFQKLLHNA